MAEVGPEYIDTTLPTPVVGQLLQGLTIVRGGLENVSHKDQATLLSWAEAVQQAGPLLRVMPLFGPDHVPQTIRIAADQLTTVLAQEALPDVVNDQVVLVGPEDFLGEEDCDNCDATDCPWHPDFEG